MSNMHVAPVKAGLEKKGTTAASLMLSLLKLGVIYYRLVSIIFLYSKCRNFR